MPITRRYVYFLISSIYSAIIHNICAIYLTIETRNRFEEITLNLFCKVTHNAQSKWPSTLWFSNRKNNGCLSVLTVSGWWEFAAGFWRAFVPWDQVNIYVYYQTKHWGREKEIIGGWSNSPPEGSELLNTFTVYSASVFEHERYLLSLW